jgi:hypothetical protein
LTHSGDVNLEDGSVANLAVESVSLDIWVRENNLPQVQELLD